METDTSESQGLQKSQITLNLSPGAGRERQNCGQPWPLSTTIFHGRWSSANKSLESNKALSTLSLNTWRNSLAMQFMEPILTQRLGSLLISFYKIKGTGLKMNHSSEEAVTIGSKIYQPRNHTPYKEPPQGHHCNLQPSCKLGLSLQALNDTEFLIYQLQP